MVTVLASGVFDILHLGHIHYLQEAKKLGDKLIVVVATDARVKKQKHEPITPQEMRVELVKSLRCVDEAVLGEEGDIYDIVIQLKPDIIALGYDQTHDPERIQKELSKRGLKNIKVVRLPQFDHDLSGTRKIIRKIIDWHAFQEKMKKIEGDKKL
jgi:FAD synthetase